MSKVQLSGKLTSHNERNIKSLVAFLPLVELISYVDTINVHNGLEIFFQAAKSANNKKKVMGVEQDIKDEITKGGLTSPLALTVVINGSVQLQNKRSSSSIVYDSESAFVVGNLLIYNAILNLLGVKAPLFSSRLTSSELEKNSICRQQLAVEDVVLTILFDEHGIDDERVRELFFKYQRRNPELHLTQFSGRDSFPLQGVIRQLSLDLDLSNYGGVSEKAKHVRSSEKYITTEYILFKVIVGSIAGERLQEYAKMSDEVSLEDGTMAIAAFQNAYRQHIEAFFKGWLEPIYNGPEQVRGGFRLSAQIWQALSLVIHELVSRGAEVTFVKSAGLKLGQLDYSKQAPHWKNCAVMDLDSNGRLFKSAVKSTREFRRGLKEYFLNYITES
ncbi:hypothetical protein L8S00_14590 [Vibrio splendidus]|uniref:hypothetical protein n=1 Tax=Vibrio splendidus TaxID=29497 RepID=UPI002468272A|nr:hypothetical protein [Vibrio splendidus]MDH5904629.1 hypothetical protein [Vibrio splendidus]